MNDFIPVAGAAIIIGGLAFAFDARTTEIPFDESRDLKSESGMTLYLYDKDTQGHSNCLTVCAKNWPPFAATAERLDQMGFSQILRPDGIKQLAHMGHPLYLSTKDSKPGDSNGNGYKNLWHAARS